MSGLQVTSTASRPREEWLDGLKGFAALLVVLGHVLSGYLDARLFPEALYSFYPVRSWIYSFHMPLFFMLSGFTFTMAYWDQNTGRLRRSRYLRQLISIAWLYVLFALLQWCVKAVVPALVNEPLTVSDLLRMFIEPIGNFWYLYVLFVFYLLGVILQLPRLKPVWLLLLGGISIVVLDYCLNWYQLTLYRILYHFFFFALGSALCVHRPALRSGKLMGIGILFLVPVGLIWYFYWPRWWYANWAVCIALANSYVFIWLFTRFRTLARFPLFKICGKYSLELYLLHTFFTGGFRTVLTMAGVVSPWLHVWLNFLLSTILCLMIAALAARIPALDLLFHPSRFLSRHAKEHSN